MRVILFAAVAAMLAGCATPNRMTDAAAGEQQIASDEVLQREAPIPYRYRMPPRQRPGNWGGWGYGSIGRRSY